MKLFYRRWHSIFGVGKILDTLSIIHMRGWKISKIYSISRRGVKNRRHKTEITIIALAIWNAQHMRRIILSSLACVTVEISWNVVAHAQKPDFVFRRNGRIHLNRRGLQFGRLLAAEVWGSAVVMLDTPCSGAVWRVPATQSIRHFPLHLPSRASPCAITFHLESTKFPALSLKWQDFL
jgi:hypothetical protein